MSTAPLHSKAGIPKDRRDKYAWDKTENARADMTDASAGATPSSGPVAVLGGGTLGRRIALMFAAGAPPCSSSRVPSNGARRITQEG